MSCSLFHDMGKMEREGNLSSAFNLSMEILSNKSLVGLHAVATNNLVRINKKIDSLIHDYWVEPKVIYEGNKNPKSYHLDISGKLGGNLPVIVSLTTISGRLNRLKKTIASIKNQSVDLHSINLYVSKEPYLLDAGIDENCQELKDIHDMGVNIYSVTNIGPYRKQIPIVYQLKNTNAPSCTPIVTMDDDVIYPNNIVERLLSISDSVVAHRGRKIVFSKGGIGNYGEFCIPKNRRDYLNLGTGKNGILYRLAFFPNNIKGYAGPIIAPTTDDLWCKWVTAFSCIPTHILETQAAYDPKLDFEESDPMDKNGLFHKFNKQGKIGKGNNDIAIKSLENYYLYNFGQNIFSIYSFGEVLL